MSIFNKPQQKPMPTFSTSQTVLPSAAISRIESGSLAELNVPNLMLKKGEKCCFVDKSYEMVETTTTRNIRKSGGTSMPSVFFKGVRYHMGSSESVPVTETKVDYMTASKTDIFGSRSFNGLHPFIGIKLGRIKSTCQFGILFIIQIIVCHSPLTGSEHGI